MNSTTPPPARVNQIWFNLRSAVTLVWQAAPRWTLLSLALAPALALLPLLILYLFKLIIDRVGAAVGNPAPVEWSAVGGLFLWIAGVAVLHEALRALGAYGEAVMEEQVLDHVHARLHAKSVAVDLAYYEQAEYHHTLYRAQREAAYRPVQVLKNLVLLGQSALSLAGVAALLATLHWGVTLVLVASTIPGLVVRLRYAGKHYLRQRAWTTADRLAWYFHELMTGAAAAKEVRLFGLGDWLQRRYAGFRQEVRDDRLAFSRRRSGVEFVAQVSASLAMFGSLAWAASLALAGKLTVGGLVLYFQAFQRGLTSLREMLAALASVHENSLFLTDFHDFLALDNTVADPPRPQPIPIPIRQGIRFENVAFGYPGGGREVLHGISLEIKSGETLALVGLNGAGKTTLIKLLCRLYDPTAGRITVDGIDLRDFPLAGWRRQVDVLFQDYARYNLTVRENIALGQEGSDATSTPLGFSTHDGSVVAGVGHRRQDFRGQDAPGQNSKTGSEKQFPGSTGTSGPGVVGIGTTPRPEVTAPPGSTPVKNFATINPGAASVAKPLEAKATPATSAPPGSATPATTNNSPGAIGLEEVTAAAAEAAGVAEAIRRLPHGFETVLGNEYLDGSLISGGEWQKIALARTLLRASPVVVLDEPTSSIDAEAESEILHRFRELMRGRTAIVISHRLAFAREVDRIIVLDEGRIVETGDHTTLMAREGKYARMFRLQAERYGGSERESESESERGRRGETERGRGL